MRTEVEKDVSYSRRMIGEGNEAVVDTDFDYKMELPEWADEKKIALGQRFFLPNIYAMAHALLIGLIATASTNSITKILQFTKQSSTPAKAYRRFKANGLHAQLWYRYPIKEGTPAWESLETVRRIHVLVNRRTTKAELGIISQTDMALTQFLFMGFPLLMPEKFGIVGSYEQFDAFSHFWRVIGYMLGVDDRFNACGATLEETRSRLKSIFEDILRPAMMIPNENFDNYTKIVCEGMWHSDPTIHYDTRMFFLKRAMNIPGYHFFGSEALKDAGHKKAFDSLSLYCKFRVTLDIIIFEYLFKIVVFRWIFNILGLFVSLFDAFPILAIMSYGKDIAYVKLKMFKKNN